MPESSPIVSHSAASERRDGVPRHVAIIMDGNGRWATSRAQPRVAGHRAGTENVRAVITRLHERGVEYVTLFAFSTENWTRPQEEVSALQSLLTEVVKVESEALHRNNVRINHIGRLDRIPADLKQGIEDAIELTAGNDGLRLTVAFDYGGRADVIQAVKRMIADGIPAEDVDEDTLASYLYTSGMPDPDLLIRTGGEVRISNFLLWQSAYTELYSTHVHWPDFDGEQVDLALAEYGRRQRRFGSLGDTSHSRG